MIQTAYKYTFFGEDAEVCFEYNFFGFDLWYCMVNIGTLQAFQIKKKIICKYSYVPFENSCRSFIHIIEFCIL
jgi:hypothetical protein